MAYQCDCSNNPPQILLGSWLAVCFLDKLEAGAARNKFAYV